MHAWNKGLTKETDSRIAAMAKAKTGRTKYNDSGHAAQAAKISGRTKENNASVAAMARTKTGRTKYDNIGIANQSEKMKELWQNLEFYNKMCKIRKDFANSERGKQHLLEASKLGATVTKTIEYRIAHREIMKEWANMPENAWKVEKAVSAMLKARYIRPNKSEQKLNGILQTYFPNNFKYTGNGQVRIEHCYPDFININGKKQVIELLGVYWHPLFDAAIKQNQYKEYGFECLCIWEDELLNESRLVKKIRKFIEKKKQRL